MATRKKTKGKAKRNKPRVTKAAPRRKTAAARKTKTSKAKAAKKQPQRVSPPKKTTLTTKAAVKPRPVTPPGQPGRVGPTPGLPAQSAPQEERVGVVTHYYGHPSVATIRLESGALHVGDMVHIRGRTTDFSQKVESLEVNHTAVTEVGPKDDFGLKVVEHARVHDIVLKVRSQRPPGGD